MGDDRAWLRTGDLGFLHDQSLYVTGRSKARIIVRGVNHAAEDLEYSLENAVTGLVPGGIAVFSSERGDREALIVLAERLRGSTLDDTRTLQELRRVLVGEHGARLRFLLTCEHRESQFEDALEALASHASPIPLETLRQAPAVS